RVADRLVHDDRVVVVEVPAAVEVAPVGGGADTDDDDGREPLEPPLEAVAVEGLGRERRDGGFDVLDVELELAREDLRALRTSVAPDVIELLFGQRSHSVRPREARRGPRIARAFRPASSFSWGPELRQKRSGGVTNRRHSRVSGATALRRQSGPNLRRRR